MTYTERYVDAVVRHLPPAQQAEVADDVRTLIADTLEARVAEGATDDKKLEAEVLKELGDPAQIATQYIEGPTHLIGPSYYLIWRRLIVLVSAIAAPIVAVLAGFGAWMDDDGFWSIVGATVGAALVTLMAIGFWMTLVFAILERTAPDPSQTRWWTVDNLPEKKTSTVKVGESVAEIVILLVGIAFLAWLILNPDAFAVADGTIPLLSPELASYFLPGLIAVGVVEIVAIIARQVRGHWSTADIWVTAGLALASAAILLPTLLSGTLLNPAAFESFGWPDADSPFTLDELQLFIAVIAVIGGIASTWEAVRKSNYRRG